VEYLDARTPRRPIYSGPLVVLTDKGSASATEIMAGALQDYNRAVVVGESSTFGKGSVQKFVEISDYMPVFSNHDRAGRLKLTIQKYYRPSGSSVQKIGVIPDIVLPSFSDVDERGEAYERNVLPHDIIRQAEGFKPKNREPLHIAELTKLSELRRANDQDFKYLAEDIARAKKQNEENKVSVNIETRRAEAKEREERRKKRNEERAQRFSAIEEADKKDFKVYRLTLDDLKADKLPLLDRKEAEERHFRMLKDDLDDLDDSLEWPSGIDSVKREGLHILRDLTNAVKKNRMVVVPKKEE
ncbi:carboxy terminal-processing peptidase, partial [Akkermansiaceae bacterium]|nr:carboxy terminal-processing peptidase [Akkermansiaceae bacterium]